MPITPPPQPSFTNATALWSNERLDSVLCVSAGCYDDNVPSNPGNYTVQWIEGVAISNAPGPNVTINGKAYPVVPLNLCFSYEHNDNYVATNASCPDASYTVTFSNGWVLEAGDAPGTVPLQIWLKQYNSTKLDYAALASPAGLAWAQANGYTYQWTTGYLLSSVPPPTAVSGYRT